MMQPPPIRDDGLQLHDRRKFQQAFWIVERVAWVVFAVVIVLALLGLTGSGGYFSKTKEELAGGEVEYPRISRWEASDELRASFEGGAETHRLTFSPSLYEYFEIEGIEPEAERVFTGPNGVVMEFAAEEGAPVEVIVYLRGLHPGIVRYRVNLNGDTVDASTLILP